MSAPTMGTSAYDLAVVGPHELVEPVRQELARQLADRPEITWRIADAGGDPGDPNVLTTQATGVLSMGATSAVTLGQSFLDARVVIVCLPEPIALPTGEARLRGRGVSYCASCDGALAAGHDVVSWLTAPALLGELRHLEGARTLTVVVPEGEAGAGLQRAARATVGPGARTLTGTVSTIAGTSAVESIALADGQEIDAQYLFMLTDDLPAAVLVPGAALDDHGMVLVDDYGATSLPGILALGPGTGSSSGSAASNESSETLRTAVIDTVIDTAIDTVSSAVSSAALTRSDPHPNGTSTEHETH